MSRTKRASNGNIFPGFTLLVAGGPMAALTIRFTLVTIVVTLIIDLSIRPSRLMNLSDSSTCALAARQLGEIVAQLSGDGEQRWADVEAAAQTLANGLRVRDGA